MIIIPQPETIHDYRELVHVIGHGKTNPFPNCLKVLGFAVN